MNRWCLLTLTIVGSLLLLLLGACSDDKDPVTSNDDLTQQETDSSIVATTVGERLFSTPLQSIELSTALLEEQGVLSSRQASATTRAASDGDEIIISLLGGYEYTNGWHVFDFEAVVVDSESHDTVEVAGVDSVQVLIDGQPQQIVPQGSEPDGLKARAHLGWDLVTGDAYCDLNHRIDIDADHQELDTVLTINGTIHDTLHAFDPTDTLTCGLDVSYDVVVADLMVSALAADGDCPMNGEIDAVAEIEAECCNNDTPPDSISIHGTWTVNAKVNDNNTVTLRYSNGFLTFTVTEDCDDTAAKRSAWYTQRDSFRK